MLTNLMSMIPKRITGAVRWVATMGTAWRVNMCLDSLDDRDWNAEVSHVDDSATPGASCLRAMGETQIALDILYQLGFETLEEVWGLHQLL